MTDYDSAFYTHDYDGKHVRTQSEFRLEDFHWTGDVLYSQAVDLAKRYIQLEWLKKDSMRGFSFTEYKYRGRVYILASNGKEYGFATDFAPGFATEKEAEVTWGFSAFADANEAAKKQIDAELAMDEAMQSIHDDRDDGQYAILYEGFHAGHKYMVVDDQQNNTIGYATDFDQDLRGLAPNFSQFNFIDAVTEEQAIRAARTEIDHRLSPVTNIKPKEEVSMGAAEEKEVTEAKRVMSWAIIKLTQSIEHLRDLCKRKDWDDMITYDMEEAKTKLGGCLADLTVWDEESFEKGSTWK